MDRRTLRAGAVGVAMTALLALGATTASARTALVPSLRARARALERSQILPRGVFSETTVYLQTAPVDVVRHGVANSMTVSLFSDPAFGSSSLAVSLTRFQADGRALQFHDYGFSPLSGIQFRYDKKTLASATIDTTTAISPSRITGTFTATSVRSQPCRLFDGRQATRLVAHGTLAFGAFDVVTSTAPFFGTIHTQPTKATVVKDPGCDGGIVFSTGAARAVRAVPRVDAAIGAPAYRERREQPCFFNRALGAKVGAGRVFGFSKEYRVPAIFEFALRTRQVPPVESESHFIDAAARRTSLPKPVKVAAGRFEAVVRGQGGEFLHGTATFSSGPPTVARGFACRANGRLRPFTRLTYRGTLDPTPASPLVASFDTLPLGLREGTPATYVVRRYGRRLRGE
jgi:hypothetical protein